MNKYWRSVVSVLTGTAVAQAIPVLGALIITRLFAPAEFGIFSAWLGLVMLLVVFLTFRFEMTLAIEEDGQPRRLAVAATLITTTLVSAIVAASLLIGAILFPNLLTKYPSTLVSTCLPTAFLFAASNLWQAWAAAEGEYRKLSYMRIIQTGLITLFQIGAGVWFSNSAALVISQLLGLFFSLALAIYIIPLSNLPKKSELLAYTINFWKKYRRFPIFSLPASFINTAAIQLPVLIVAGRFGSDIAGLLAMTIKVLGAPIGLLGKSVLDVFVRHAASSYRERGECREEYIKTFYALTLGSLAFCFIMALSGENLFILAFGQEWSHAGKIAVWLLPMFALRFIASPLSYMVYIADKQHLDLIWQIGLLGVTLACLAWISEYKLALQAYSISYAALYLIYLAMSYRFSQGRRG
ncbi:polysaccharide biosynthesis protein [Pseudomonas sp. ATCC 13867]|uniref:lipopolysaccharide biosynthesis protein n=1 Tax=Pseudomonas sp. ATCC 13867 TaxID=1294143 RepID=UPI0002C4F543|nr:lipopolysaccharide biosynthesis protein [Pseudomonas sp. ATCC 13867]AGI26515.1 polysaccharide biosynthesis protein [Pseudomonas sp. ATCC 13867]